MFKAILFDLDGVLIETEKETFQFYQQELAKIGIHLKDSDFKFKAGRKSADFWQDVLTPEQQSQVDTKALVRRKRDLFNEYPDRYVKKMDGGEELLQLLRAEGFKIALASQNELRMIKTVMDWLGIKKYFDAVASIDDIANLKPDPEIYLLAANKLGVSPKESLVVEDSRDGVNSAKNAGMKCIGINHEYSPADALDRADAKVNGLREIDLNLVKTLE